MAVWLCRDVSVAHVVMVGFLCLLGAYVCVFVLQDRLKPYVGKSLADVAFDKQFWDVYELLEPTMVYVQLYLSDM
jgi:hypothetical protein